MVQISSRHPQARLLKIKIGKVRSWHKKLPLSRKMFVFLCVTAIVVVLSYYLFYAQAKPVNFNQISQYSTHQLNQIAINLTVKLRDYETISQQFLTNQDLNRLLTEYTQTRDTYDVASQNTTFSNYLNGYAFTDPYFYDAMFVDEANIKRKILTMGEALPDNFIRTFRNTRWFQQIVQADGKAVWFSKVQLDDQPQYYFLMGRRIKNLFTGKPLGVLLFVISEQNIGSMINDGRFDEHYQGQNLKSDFTLMVDDKGIIIASPLGIKTGESIYRLIGRPRTLPVSIRGNLPSQSYMSVSKIKKQPVLVVVYPLEMNGWKLMNLIPIVVPKQQHTLVNRLLYGFGYVILVFGIIFEIWFGIDLSRVMKSRIWGLRNGKTTENNCANEPAWLGELNEKEREVLILLAQGYTNKEIAKQLFVAEQTIKNYVSTIYSKLDVHDRVQASLKAIDAGLTVIHPK